ncbi:hypothetical protein ACFSTH_13065 [Paenibacillus yanchengensis]|uniref:SHOCT domain-containing protein n=1 Tax=Paenibacillus yanchengensis TaxID=2035833 RepID=A0ABW4YNQ4_9BACL
MIVFSILFLIGFAKSITWLMVTSILFLIVGFVLARNSSIKDLRKVELIQQQLDSSLSSTIQNVGDFETTQQFVSVNKMTAIAIDENRKKVCLIEFDHEKLDEITPMSILNDSIDISYVATTFPYDDILQLEILSDGSSITKTSRKGQFGGAIIGGALAGGVGAIIGGTGASQTTKEMVKKIQLRIIVNNSFKTYYEITFQKFEAEVSKEKSYYNDVTHWYNLLSYIIKNDKENEKSEPIQSSGSVSDEILKISELYEKKLISKEEFESLKKSILNKELI